MDEAAWRRRVAGESCPMDAPRPDSNPSWDLVAKLSVSSLYLSKDQTYRGRCVLIFDLRHAARPDQLTREEWLAFSADLHAGECAVMRAFAPDHVNLESLGNVVPHLHWHIVPRYRDDPRWGDPIWLTRMSDMREQRLDAREQAECVARVRGALYAASA